MDEEEEEEEEAEEVEDNPGVPLSIYALAAKVPKDKPSGGQKFDPRSSRPKTEVGRFQGVELTSLINMIDLESKDAGSQPLVDLNVGPRLDSGPRVFADSTPQGLPPYANLGGMPGYDPNARPNTPPLDRSEMMMRVGRRGASMAEVRPGSIMRRKKSPIRAWMVIVAILIAAGVAAAIVGMSGPDVPLTQGK